MNGPKRTIISRRARPAKEPLSHEQIVQTAYRLLEDEGLPGMTMRKIAKALDTGPSSLYVYVKNAQELNAYVMDYALGQLQLPQEHDGPWKTRLFGALEAYFELLQHRPGLAELAVTTIPAGVNALSLTEYLLSALHEAGIVSRSAAWGADLFMFYVSSFLYEKTSEARGTMPMPLIQETYRSADPARFPHIARLQQEIFSGNIEARERFRWGLEVILQGLLQAKQDNA
ncbi:TetR/AcrR family transcriptional regulator [Paenibacillus daejeonensis]|uniref:TetR/AcrR family transcriptional regulator n=1 Tax=Paenibacillus daejeonensis TaxID=135193 RepID=UPI0024813BF3|nr:TetR/AcrR family transcriptional regulator [Paenibacillus daejeonensis]